MGVFSSIMSKIFHHPTAQAAQPQPAGQSQPSPQPRPPTAAAPPPAAAPETPSPAVDVAAVLDSMALDNPQQLNWRQSIVDLMKLLSLDSSLTARKELAGELGYGGDTNDSATMNIWLHKQVMAKLAENGGIVPDDLR